MDDEHLPYRPPDVEDRQKVRAARLRARQIEEMARSVFDGFIVLAATAVGLSVTHGSAWIVSAIMALVICLVGRALALWSLMADVDLHHSVIDTLSDIYDALERDQRRPPN